MGVIFTPGETLGRNDLDIFLSNAFGNPVNAFSISYALYYVDPDTCTEVLIGDAARVPVNPAVGEYYASLQIPPNATPGDYRIRWLFRETVTSTEEGAIQEFGVVADSVTTSAAYSDCITDLITKMRFMTRDNDPDRNYRFMPPEGEGTVGCYNQVFGYIWTDEEFAQYLEIALWKWNMHPPETEELSTLDKLCANKAVWKAAILWGGLVNAAQALAYNWVANEFDYSIGGISLSIEKSSKYENLKQNAEDQWDKLTEAKVRTTKYMRGLSQPRFGRGVRSAFGPYVGRGVLSPRNFI
tara:strand:- start:247 stop:1140 length:894 start_codon:yes stop_codon:yes gene_type:complete